MSTTMCEGGKQKCMFLLVIRQENVIRNHDPDHTPHGTASCHKFLIPSKYKVPLLISLFVL